MTDAWRWAQRNPSAVLLYVQLGGLLLYPFLEGPSDKLGTLVLSLFGLVVLGLAVAAVRATPSLTWVAVLIGVPAVALTFVDVFSNNAQPWHLISDLFHAAFYAYTLVALLRYMFADEHVTTDELYAIGATFTIGIWLFAYIYSICQTLVPDSFAAYGVDGGQRTWFELLFLSCTTMTSTGLSDVIPVKP
ncbi:MAG: two pore domain potassium channel family protein, partial [Propionibacteriaceae bacterium]|nr:two pore domain potassium channel family protein [Propionibacteriaceae bacterium]